MPIMLLIMAHTLMNAPYLLTREYANKHEAAGTPSQPEAPTPPFETQRVAVEGEGEDQFSFVFTQARTRGA